MNDQESVIQNRDASTSDQSDGSASGRKWTPGPWITDAHKAAVAVGGTRIDCYEVFSRKDMCWVAQVQNHRSCVNTPEGNANASLIAAAPELYDALDALDNAGMIGGHDHPIAFCKCGNCMVRRVLAKARGEVPMPGNLTEPAGAAQPRP